MDGRDVGSTNAKWHKKFNAQDGDIVVQSSDNILFRLHRNNIEAYAGAFPLQATLAIEDLPTITVETASVLEKVFEYLHPQRYPDLDSMGLKSLITFARVIEKYQVFAAMQICATRLRSVVEVVPLATLTHGVKYNYPTLINEAAPLIAMYDVLDVVGQLPPHAVIPWLRYHAAVREKVFGTVKDTLQAAKALSKVDTLCKMTKLQDRNRITPGCFATITAWMMCLDSLSARTALELELDIHKQLIKSQLCQYSKYGYCQWLCYALISFKTGLKKMQEIKFTDFLDK